MTIQAASEKLAKDAGCEIDAARLALQQFLVAAHEIRTPQGRPPFAFKLHQFISGPGKVLATLAHVLIGALDEAAMLIATADDPKKARRETRQVLHRLVDAMFTP